MVLCHSHTSPKTIQMPHGSTIGFGQCWVAIPSPTGLVRRSANFQCLQDVVRLLGLDRRRQKRHRHDDSSNPTGPRKGWGGTPPNFSYRWGWKVVNTKKIKHQKKNPDAKNWVYFLDVLFQTQSMQIVIPEHDEMPCGACFSFVYFNQPWKPGHICHSNHSIFRNGSMDWYTHQLQKRPQKTFKCFSSNNHI